MEHQAKSCDTFVVLPPLTKHGVVFGKNSDRPKGEVQDVVYLPATESSDPIKVPIFSIVGFMVIYLKIDVLVYLY